MKTFLAVYTGHDQSPNRKEWEGLAPDERSAREAEGMQAWGGWMQTHGGAFAFQGGPLGVTKRVAREGTSDIHNNLAGFVVVTAESHEAAARMFENHPHFAIFPGDAVEVMELLPIPGQ